MKKLLGMVAGIALIAGLVSCDWSGTSEDESWSDRYNWVNFSGVYRGAGGGLLVSSYSTQPGSNQGNVVTREVIQRGNGAKNSFNGTLANRQVVSGTVSIDTEVVGIGAVSLTDDGAGVLAGGGGAGTINYSTGAYSLTFTGPVVNGAAVAARYEYTSAGSSGSSGKAIVTFSVTQEGNKLTFVDNNGAVYSGGFGSVRTTQGASRDTPTSSGTPVAGDTMIGSFEVRGKSAAGYSVTITGTFQGTVGTSLQLEGRTINGTWIEEGGKTGDVNGAAS
jgi:hypothetical protein